jgi:hypothetical protein
VRVRRFETSDNPVDAQETFVVYCSLQQFLAGAAAQLDQLALENAALAFAPQLLASRSE